MVRHASLRRPPRVFPSVPKLWPGSTVVCIASGPSLTRDDVEYVRGRARVIVVNDNYRLAPWADALYAADAGWWREHRDTAAFTGLKFGIGPSGSGMPKSVMTLRNTGTGGLEIDPTGMKTGRNSGYQAINLAVHLGAKRILLLGYDMQVDTTGKAHWFGAHVTPLNQPTKQHFQSWLKLFPTLIAPLSKIGIEVVNCSRVSALTCFRKQPLRDALPEVLEQAS